MKHSVLSWTCAVTLSLGIAAPAWAGSVTQPGETLGLAAGAPLPEGLYFINTTNWGVRNVDGVDVAVGVTIPVLAWSTPLQFLGARVQLLAATPLIEIGVEGEDHVYGVYNPFLGGQLAWDLGNGFGASYALGAYFRVNNDVAFDSTSINQRFALSYTENDWNLTANAIWGIHVEGDNPDFLNLDLTATRKFGQWELGPVAFGSTDLDTPDDPFVGRQRQVALGGLVGYDFGPVTLQAYLTRDVYERNYGGKDTRFWARAIIPLWSPSEPEPVEDIVYQPIVTK